MAGYRKSKYSAEDTQRWTGEAMFTLSEEKRAMTCAEIQSSNLQLVGLTPQKLSRCLNDLCERGLVVKTKGRDNLMHYKSVGVIIEEGYSMADLVY